MKKTCKRKHYALINPALMAMEGAAVTPDTAMASLRTRELSVIESFAKGHATTQEWYDMTAMLNLCETMARAGVGREALPVCEVVQAEMTAAIKRYEATKRMGLTGPGITALRELYQYHDLQRTSICRLEYEQHIQHTTNLVKGKSKHVCA